MTDLATDRDRIRASLDSVPIRSNRVPGMTTASLEAAVDVTHSGRENALDPCESAYHQVRLTRVWRG